MFLLLSTLILDLREFSRLTERLQLRDKVLLKDVWLKLAYLAVAVALRSAIVEMLTAFLSCDFQGELVLHERLTYHLVVLSLLHCVMWVESTQHGQWSPRIGNDCLLCSLGLLSTTSTPCAHATCRLYICPTEVIWELEIQVAAYIRHAVPAFNSNELQMKI